jgi:hypothetical protein
MAIHALALDGGIGDRRDCEDSSPSTILANGAGVYLGLDHDARQLRAHACLSGLRLCRQEHHCSQRSVSLFDHSIACRGVRAILFERTAHAHYGSGHCCGVHWAGHHAAIWFNGLHIGKPDRGYCRPIFVAWVRGIHGVLTNFQHPRLVAHHAGLRTDDHCALHGGDGVETS